MAATDLQVNWVDVEFASTPINRVSNVTITPGGQILTYSGDNDRFPVVAVNASNQPRASVTSGNVAAIMALVPGTAGTFTATHKDARGQELGDIVFALLCVVENTDMGGQHAQFGQATASFLGVSADGQTNPLSFTRA